MPGVARGSCRGWKRLLQGLEEVLAGVERGKRFLLGLEEVLAGVGRGKRFLLGLEEVLAGVGRGLRRDWKRDSCKGLKRFLQGWKRFLQELE
jgi:hypothetical protein